MAGSSTTDPDTVALHGWTAVPRDADALLQGKPYLHKPEPLLVRDIRFPSDDPIVARVQQYAKEKLPSQTYSHSMRVYYYATAILTQQFSSHTGLSLSTLALTSLLHDIGTTHSNLRATQLSFEFYGGLLARELLQTQLESTQSQAEAVCEAIIRHQDLGAVGSITLLGQLIQLATIHDNMGGHAALVHADTRADVNRAFPRDGWSRCFAATIREENGLKPWAHTTHLGEEEFPRGVEGNELMAEYDGWK
ncbi:urea hydro-lyase cyanamide [Podospora appendiculata]|uniref:Urea hydro-lyase cyanamide n=1 Tax=Podospora appendiculata TaxID=314037 RepID=A0AAE0X891_9PEZI|nr:urea hydro-lyase cyanamide [Podospora appendiculata]